MQRSNAHKICSIKQRQVNSIQESRYFYISVRDAAVQPRRLSRWFVITFKSAVQPPRLLLRSSQTNYLLATKVVLQFVQCLQCLQTLRLSRLYILLLEKKRKKRRYWMHPLLYKRPSISEFHKRYNNLTNYPEQFFNYYRMSIKTFYELINLIESDIVWKGNRRGLRKPTEQRTSERFSLVM